MARPRLVPDGNGNIKCNRCGKPHSFVYDRRNGSTCKECVRKRCDESTDRLKASPKVISRNAKYAAARKRNRYPPDIDGNRTCNKCKNPKPFPKEFRGGRHHRVCLECYNAGQREYRLSNIEWLRPLETKQAARYREANREKVNSYMRANRKVRRATDPVYRNAECLRSRARESLRRGANGVSVYSPAFVEELRQLQRSVCASPVCEVSIADKYEIDHIMPIALGGSNVPGNIQLLCPQCNHRKHKKHPEKWLLGLGLSVPEDGWESCVSRHGDARNFVASIYGPLNP